MAAKKEVDKPPPVTPPKDVVKSRPVDHGKADDVTTGIKNDIAAIRLLIGQEKFDDAASSIKNYIAKIDKLEDRSLDPFLAKGFFYMTLVAERQSKISDLRGYLNSRLRVSTLRNQTHTVAVLIVCLLRIFLLTKNFSGASKLLTKVSFPEAANNNDLARFLYYQGRIKAVELDYNAASKLFQLALRKAPTDGAIGFKQNVNKWIVVIQLLQGLIPERSLFRVAAYKKPLAPYLELTHGMFYPISSAKSMYNF